MLRRSRKRAIYTLNDHDIQQAYEQNSHLLKRQHDALYEINNKLITLKAQLTNKKNGYTYMSALSKIVDNILFYIQKILGPVCSLLGISQKPLLFSCKQRDLIQRESNNILQISSRA